PAGKESSRNGSVCAIWSSPVVPAPAPRASTATIGAAARPICSADWAARLDQARRVNAAGSRSEVVGAGTSGSGAGCVRTVAETLRIESPCNAAGGRRRARTLARAGRWMALREVKHIAQRDALQRGRERLQWRPTRKEGLMAVGPATSETVY